MPKLLVVNFMWSLYFHVALVILHFRQCCIDVLFILPKGSVIPYTDDIVIIGTGKIWREAQIVMNIFLGKIKRWLDLNQLSLRLSKTVYTIFFIVI